MKAYQNQKGIEGKLMYQTMNGKFPESFNNLYQRDDLLKDALHTIQSKDARKERDINAQKE